MTPERVLARRGGRSSAGVRAGQRVGDNELVGAEEGGQLTPKFGEWTVLEDVDLPVDAWKLLTCDTVYRESVVVVN